LNGGGKGYSPGKEMIHGKLMGKGAISMLTTLTLVTLLLFLMLQPASTASQAIPTCDVDSLVLDDQYRLVLTLGPWSQEENLTDLGIIIVSPIPGSPDMSERANYLKLKDSHNLSFVPDVMMSYQPNSTEGQGSEGDRIVVRSTGTGGLPQGQWQLYLVEVNSSASLLGIIWTIGNEPSFDYQLPFARSSITDPVQYFGFSSQGGEWVFVAIIGSEMILLAVIVYLISRAK
jgi:hypothetical protein